MVINQSVEGNIQSGKSISSTASYIYIYMLLVLNYSYARTSCSVALN